MRKKLMTGVSLESIKFQSGVFFKELASLYAEIRSAKMSEAKLDKDDSLQTISKCIRHHTGLTVHIEINENGPAVIIPHVNKNHPFIDEFSRSYFGDGDVYAVMKKAGGVIHGSVDLGTSRVDGVFGKIDSAIFIPYEWLMRDNVATVEELAAVTLHEVGHLFTYYEYISRSTTTNQVLAALSRGYAQADTIDKRTALLISAKKALALKEEGIEDLAKSNSIDVVNAVIITNLVEKSRSELGINIYDLNSWEYLADEFAARHQAGKHLITAFDKIYRKHGHMSFRGTGKFIAMEAFKVSMVLLGIMAIPGFGQAAIIPLMFGMIMISADADIVIYDEPEARIRRVKQQIIENLKDKKLSADDVLRLNEDIKTVDSILEHVQDKRQLLGVIYDALSPKGRKNRNMVLLQQQLESIANNDLFAKAAEFKTMAA